MVANYATSLAQPQVIHSIVILLNTNYRKLKHITKNQDPHKIRISYIKKNEIFVVIR